MRLRLRRAGQGVRRPLRGDHDSRHLRGHRHCRRGHRCWGHRHRGSYRRHRRRLRLDGHRRLHRDHDHQGRAGRHRGRAGSRRDDRQERDGIHPGAGAYCPATCRAVGRPDGVPADAESAGRPAAPRRTGCCRRAGYARRASAQWARGPASDQALRRGPEPGWSVSPPGPRLQPWQARRARQPVPRGLRGPPGPRAWRRAPSRGRPLPRRPWQARRCRRPWPSGRPASRRRVIRAVDARLAPPPWRTLI
jgi:hypothetical protein